MQKQENRSSNDPSPTSSHWPTRFERGVRRFGYIVIALFVLLLFIPYVGISLYDAIRRNPRAAFELIRLPGCWLIVFGPILFWISLVAFYFRLPKELRTTYVASRRVLYFGAMRLLLAEYRRQHGYDWLIWMMAAS